MAGRAVDGRGILGSPWPCAGPSAPEVLGMRSFNRGPPLLPEKEALKGDGA